MSDDYTKDYIDDVAKDLGGKEPGEIAKELKKQMLMKEYIDQATEGMPGKQRAEVARELKTHILDSADALAAERKVPVDVTILKEVLDKMGPAKKIAAMYPTKKTILDHGFGKALISLAGIAIAFLMVAAVLQLVAPDVMNITVPGSNPAQNVMQIVLSVVFALALATVVIAIIFLLMYIYESRLKTPYEARLKSLEHSLNQAASPIKAVAMIIANVVWLTFMNLYWSHIPFVQSFGDNPILVPLLSDKFGPFLLFLNMIGIANIVVALLYLAVAQKWIPSLLEALLSLCSALLFIWLLSAFPFNETLSSGVVFMIKVLMAAVVVGCLIGAARQIWQTMKLAMFEKNGKNEAA